MATNVIATQRYNGDHYSVFNIVNKDVDILTEILNDKKIDYKMGDKFVYCTTFYINIESFVCEYPYSKTNLKHDKCCTTCAAKHMRDLITNFVYKA